MRKTFLIGAALSVLIVSLATAFEQQSPYLERVSTGRALADDAVLVIPRSRQDTTEEKLNTDASQDTSTQAGSSPGNSAASPGETKAPTSGTDSGSDSSPASSAAKSPTPKQPDDRDALLTSLYVGIEKPGISKPVYKEQELVDPFKSCLAAPSDGMNTTSCYEDDEYNDRLTFELTFSVRATVLQKAFEKHFPRLELSPEDRNVAQPQIGNAGLPGIEYSDYTAKVTVSYHCQSTSSGVISLKLVLQLGDAEKDAVTIEWMKICKSGINNNIEFGYLMRETGQTAGPSAYSFAEDSIPALVVAPSDVSTEVYLKIQEPGARQEFVAPYVTTTNPDVASVAVRGNHPSGGVLKYLEQSTFQLSYECLRKGNLEIHTTIGIPPFNNLTATWTKGLSFSSLLA